MSSSPPAVAHVITRSQASARRIGVTSMNVSREQVISRSMSITSAELAESSFL
jgi:hypothetical protein